MVIKYSTNCVIMREEKSDYNEKSERIDRLERRK